MKIKSGHSYYVLICSDDKFVPRGKECKIICGVYSTRKEAEECKEAIKDCVCRHYIRKCSVTVEFPHVI